MHCATQLLLTAAFAAIISCNTIPTSSDVVQRRDIPDYVRAGRVDLGDAVAGIGSLIIGIIQSTVKGQQKQRAAYTKATAQELRSTYPDKNVVIFHDQESAYSFVNGEHLHHEVDLYRSLGTYGYEIWIFDSGSFHLHGDGGYMNWAFAGNHERRSERDIVFFPIDSPEVSPPGLPKDQLLPPDSPIRRIREILRDRWRTPSRRSVMDAEDGNYFLNCRSNDGNVSSGIAYYKNLVPGQMLDKIPDDYVEVSRGGNIDWETVSSVHFPNRNITLTWSILGDSENAGLDEACGVASNGHEGFWLYRSPGSFLFEKDGNKCNAMYWGF